MRAQAAQLRGRGRPPVPEPPPPIYIGIDLSKAPVSTKVEALTDLFEEKPPGSHSYEMRDTVEAIKGITFKDPLVYWVKDKDCFYIQSDPLGSSGPRHFYGPFKGDPNPALAAATQPAGAATQPAAATNSTD